MEDFKEISEYSGYLIGNMGTIIGKTNNIMKQHIDKDGYYRIGLRVNNCTKNVLVSRLVALAWIPNPDNKPEVDHIDQNTLNNISTNLRWVTSAENMDNRNIIKKEIIAINTRTKDEKEFDSITDAARVLGIYRQSIRKILSNEEKYKRYKSIGGYYFKYKEV